LQDPAKFTQIGIFGLKTNHLATLMQTIVRTKKRKLFFFVRSMKTRFELRSNFD
jgi:hypothetical protein